MRVMALETRCAFWCTPDACDLSNKQPAGRVRYNDLGPCSALAAHPENRFGGDHSGRVGSRRDGGAVGDGAAVANDTPWGRYAHHACFAVYHTFQSTAQRRQYGRHGLLLARLKHAGLQHGMPDALSGHGHAPCELRLALGCQVLLGPGQLLMLPRDMSAQRRALLRRRTSMGLFRIHSNHSSSGGGSIHPLSVAGYPPVRHWHVADIRHGPAIGCWRRDAGARIVILSCPASVPSTELLSANAWQDGTRRPQSLHPQRQSTDTFDKAGRCMHRRDQRSYQLASL